jgi:hypothetical protein
MREFSSARRLAGLVRRPREAGLLVIASTLLPLCWVTLRVGGLARLCTWIGRPLSRGAACALADVPSWTLAVSRAARYTPFPVTCLTRSLLLAGVLRRGGVDARLRIGVRCHEAALEAHAWVELQGVPLNESAETTAQFSVFDQPLPLGAFGRT